MSPAYVPTGLKVNNTLGYGTLFGYHFQIFLPHKGEPITDTNKLQKASTHQASIDAQEKNVIFYAWPVCVGNYGK